MKISAVSPEEPPAPAKGAVADARTVAKGGGIQVIGQFANKVLTFVFVAVAVRILGASGYGLYREVFQILTIATMIAAGGFPYAALRYVARARALKDHGAVRGAARATLIGTAAVSAVVVLVIVAGSHQLASAFADSASDRSELMRLLMIGVAFVPMYGIMQVLRSCTQAYKTMVPSVMIGNVVQPLSRMLVGIAVLLIGFGVAGAVSALVLSAALSMVAGFWYFHRLLTAEERSARPKIELGPVIRFSIPQAGVSLFSTSSLGIAIIILGVFGSDRAVGLYGIAQALQLAGNMFLTSIVAIFSAVVVGLYEKGETARLQSIYQTTNRWVATFGFPVLTALIVFPSFFARALGGSDALAASTLIPILAVGNLFYVGTGPCGYLLSMTGRPGVNLVNSVTSVLLYIGLGIWLVPIYGAVGMAIVDLVVTVLVNSARAVEIRILMGVHPFGRSFVKPVAATLAAGLCLFAWSRLVPQSFVLQITGLAVFGLVYLGILRVLGVDPEERDIYDAIKARLFRRSKKAAADVA